MTEMTCRCGRPTSGAFLCDRCVKTLDVALVNVPAYFVDLETLRTKRARYGSGAATKGSIGKAQPLGMDLRFTKDATGSKVDHDTRNTVVAWARIVMDEQPELAGPYCRYACLHISCGVVFRRRYPADTVTSMCAYLQRQVSYIAGQRWAEDMLDEMLSIERRLARLIDRPADKWYAGKCSTSDESGNSCEAELYAEAEKGTITCRACGTRHDVAARRDFLLKEASGYDVTATEAAVALLAWTDYDGSESKLVDRIRTWRDREKLEIRDVTSLLGKDRHLYRLGDIQALMIRHAQDKQNHRIKDAS